MITIRFWIRAKKILKKVEKSKDLSLDKFVDYNGNKKPYNKYQGRFLFVVKEKQLEEMFLKYETYSALIEILINDEWFTLSKTR